jgi:hypothetical protein
MNDKVATLSKDVNPPWGVARALERGPKSHSVPLRADLDEQRGARVFVDEFKARHQEQRGRKGEDTSEVIGRLVVALTVYSGAL